jgi:hypothetical protein
MQSVARFFVRERLLRRASCDFFEVVAGAGFVSEGSVNGHGGFSELFTRE